MSLACDHDIGNISWASVGNDRFNICLTCFPGHNVAFFSAGAINPSTTLYLHDACEFGRSVAFLSRTSPRLELKHDASCSPILLLSFQPAQSKAISGPSQIGLFSHQGFWLSCNWFDGFHRMLLNAATREHHSYILHTHPPTYNIISSISYSFIRKSSFYSNIIIMFGYGIYLLGFLRLATQVYGSSDPAADQRCVESQGEGWEAQLDSAGKPIKCQKIVKEDDCFPEWKNPASGKYECW